jgi:hypothetical protein
LFVNRHAASDVDCTTLPALPCMHVDA